jgi:hypothetical protein
LGGIPANTTRRQDDLRYILVHARRDRLLAAAVERELRRRIARLRPAARPAGHDRL